MTLDEIGLKHGTDKASSHHGYLDAYEKYFGPRRDQPLRIIEFGVLAGASIRTWRDYFPSASIFAVDVNPQYLAALPEGVVAAQGDVMDPSFWEGFPHTGFDIAIDDAAHNVEAQANTMSRVLPRMSPAGLYIIEDLECSRAAIVDAVKPVIIRMNNDWQAPDGIDVAKVKTGIKFVHFCRNFIVIGMDQ